MSSRPKKWFVLLFGFFLGKLLLETLLTAAYQTNGMNS